MMEERWSRVAFARTREAVMDEFVAWRERTGRFPSEDEIRVNWGTYADGGDYWEVLVKDPDIDR